MGPDGGLQDGERTRRELVLFYLSNFKLSSHDVSFHVELVFSREVRGHTLARCAALRGGP